MSGLVKFEFEGSAVRVVGDAETPLFHSNDLCDVLGYANPHDAMARHVPEDDLVKREVIDSMGRKQSSNFVTEAGMWALVMRANTEAAKRVQRWVTHEVLPALRKTGRYETSRQSDDVKTLTAKRLESKERRLSAEFLIKTLRTINKIRPLHPDAFAATAAAAIETVAGKEMPSLKPPTAEQWFTPTQIAEQLGVTPNRIGRAITELGMRGNIEGVARAVLNKAAHSDKTITTYQYSAKAVEAIARAVNAPLVAVIDDETGKQ